MVLRSTKLQGADGLLVPKVGIAQEATDISMSCHPRNNRRSGMAISMLLISLFRLPGWMGVENRAGILWSLFRVCNKTFILTVFY